MITEFENIFTPKSSSLSSLLEGIDNHRIVLPQFQRPWKWEPEMVRDLIISIAYRYPAGSLLTMPISQTNFALRTFEGSGELRKDDRPNLMVLDGQQRLTSLYQALYRKDGVKFNNKKYHFYLDVAFLLSDPDGSIEVGDPYFEGSLFYVAEEHKQNDRIIKKVRYDGLKQIYEITTQEDELTNGALPLNLILDTYGLDDWRSDYFEALSSENIREKILRKEWNDLVRPWIDRIRSYPFPEIELRQDMSLNAICHIFEKVNSTGMPLDVFDLCTAILWAQGLELNKKWEKTLKSLKDNKILSMQPLNGTFFLQGISLLDSFDKKKHDFENRIPVTCRKHNLMEMNKETVEKWWEILCKGYKEASRFMASQGILDSHILPYSTMIIPLSAILGDIINQKGEAHLGSYWGKIEQWYWCGVFSQRYSSHVETSAAIDYEQVMNWIDGGNEPDVVRTFSFRSDNLQEISSIRNAIYKGILCLLAKNDAKDFGGKGKLDLALFTGTQQDHHHIYPTYALKKLEIIQEKDNRVDSIVNKTLISAAVNRSIGGQTPEEYVAHWRIKLGRDKLDNCNFDSILRSHAINPEILATKECKNKWDGFVVDRRERLRQLIESACGGVFQPFDDSE